MYIPGKQVHDCGKFIDLFVDTRAAQKTSVVNKHIGNMRGHGS